MTDASVAVNGELAKKQLEFKWIPGVVGRNYAFFVKWDAGGTFP